MGIGPATVLLFPGEKRSLGVLQIGNRGGSAEVPRQKNIGKGKGIDQFKDMRLPLEEDITILQYLQSRTKSERWLTIEMTTLGK